MFFQKRSGGKTDGEAAVRQEAETQVLASDIEKLAAAASQGDFGGRLDEERYGPALGAIARSINATYAAMDQQRQWFDGVLDAIPFPLSITDMDMNWTFINRPVEMFLGVKRPDVLGKQCDNWNANICNTANCGIATLRSGRQRTTFNQNGGDFQVDVSYIKDHSGQSMGHIEVVQDISESVRAGQYAAVEAQRLASHFQQMAQGQLAFVDDAAEADQHTAGARDLFSQIVENVNAMVGGLRDLIGSLQANATEVAAASRQIEQASEQSARATQQVATTIQQVAGNAHSSAQSSGQVTVLAEQGARTVSSTVSAMDAIKDSMATAGQKIQQMQQRSEQISEIVDTINEIADQTNLLALNAAIEAARAGEQGRGFAVVADEVRKLAERSSMATKEIGGLIRGVQQGVEEAVRAMQVSLSSVDSGASLAQEAGQSLTAIAQAAEQSNAEASRISEGTEDMASMTEELSAQSEEVTASAQALSEMAHQLEDLAGRFSLSQNKEKAAQRALPDQRFRAAPAQPKSKARTTVVA